MRSYEKAPHFHFISNFNLTSTPNIASVLYIFIKRNQKESGIDSESPVLNNIDTLE